MEGRAVIASTMVLTKRLYFPGISFRKTAVIKPSGMVIARAIAIWISEPRIECRIPPELSGSRGPARLMS